MPKGTITDPELKAKILAAIHDEGISAYKAAQVYGVPYKTVSSWMTKEAHGADRNYIAEINQLKKKLDNAYRVIGELTAEVKRPKG